MTSPSELTASLLDETISLEDWLNDTSITKGARRNRDVFVKAWAEANGKDRTIGAAKKLLDSVKTRKVNPYQTARKLTDWTRESGLRPATIQQYRSRLFGMFQSTLGEDSFKKSVFDRVAPQGDYYVTKTKKSPTEDELKQMLRSASSARDRALLGFLACTGCRISEATSRKLSDIEVDETTKHVKVKFQAAQTKARTKRWAFLTREVMEWIAQYRMHLNVQAKDNHTEVSEWLFPGELGDHLKTAAAYQKIKRLFSIVGCKDTDDETYSPHSLRTFADAKMAKAGLDRKFIAAIIGHKSKLAAEAAYLDWAEIENEWFDRCEQKLTWLIERHEIIKETRDPKARALLARLMKEMAKMKAFDDFRDITDLIEEGEDLMLEDKSKDIDT